MDEKTAEINPANMSAEEIAEYQRKSCVFCKIVKGAIPAKKVYEDDAIISLMDINPAAKGHIIVLPKEHYPLLPLVPKDVAARVFKSTRSIGSAVKRATGVSKISVFIASGLAAGQQSPHFLLHIIPCESEAGAFFKIDHHELTQEEFDKLDDLKVRIAETLQNQGLSNLSGNAGSARSFSDDPSLPAQDAPNTQTQGSKAMFPGEPGTSAHFPAPNPDLNKGFLQTAPSAEEAPLTHHDLAKLLNTDSLVRDKIISDPDRFKRELDNNPRLKAAFAGININKLAEALRKIKK